MSETPDEGPRRTPWATGPVAGVSTVLDLRRWRVYLTTGLRQGTRRMQGAFVPNLQAALAATVSFAIAQYGFGHTAPMFAPIATYLCLGFTRNRHPRRVVEMGGGATVGILLGELVGETFGFGWWQVLAILVVAPMIGRLADRSEMFTFQAALQSITIVGLSAATIVRPSAFGRWTDALVGTLVALVYSIVVPSRVSLRPRRYAKNALLELGRAAQTLADGLRTADDERLKDVMGQLLVVQQIVDDGEAALASGSETAAVNPRLRGDRVELAELHRMLALTQRVATTTYMLARQGRGIASETGPLPALGDLTERSARLLGFVGGSVGTYTPPKHARTKALELAAELRPSLSGEHAEWRTAVLVSLLRALVVDILQLTGLSRQAARAGLPLDEARLIPEDDPLPEDGPSAIWA